MLNKNHPWNSFEGGLLIGVIAAFLAWWIGLYVGCRAIRKQAVEKGHGTYEPKHGSFVWKEG